MILTPSEIIIAISALLLAGLAKGISGMGLPVIATPILTVLFDLKTAIALTIGATVVTDIVMLARLPKNWSIIKKSLGFMIFGACGIIIGSYLLISMNQLVLSGMLGIVIITFVVTSFFSLLPTFEPRRWSNVAVGLVGGCLQGAAGASGPIVSMYLLQMRLSRSEFLFMINSFFLVIDSTQFSAMYQMGVYKGNLAVYALLVLIPTLLALAVAFKFQRNISDKVFRHSVLVIMSLSGILLLYKSINYFI